MDYKWVGKPVVRADALDKVTGKTMYMTDLELPDMLWGKIVRSGIVHADILDIDTREAERFPGVVTVVTFKDVPGLNGYGIHHADQPVFNQNKVRYEGDIVAGVVAESREIAEQAAEKIKIKYKELPVLLDPREALLNEAIKIHKEGNLLFQARVQKGDMEKAFAEADLVIEREYYSPVQIPAYLEVEGGVAEYKDGFLSIWCGGQYPTQDQRQLSQVSGIPEERIRVVCNPLGGAFGGKDDLSVQAQLAVMAYKAGRPVKLVNTREESNKCCWKRHPMYIKMKTAAKKDGILLANQVEIISDTGAYAGLGAPVLTNTIAHACGAYRIHHVDIIGYCVYTNNSPSSAMRGFGVPQINFAMESQIEIIAETLGIDNLEIRLKNCLVTGDVGPLGNTLRLNMGIMPALLKIKETDLWLKKEAFKQQISKPWKKRGIGIAASVKGVGLGKGLPDYSNADITLTGTGEYIIAVGCPELGQGNHIVFAQIAAESLLCSIDKMKVRQGDSSCTPDSGVTAASRTTYAVGNAILLAAEGLKEKIKRFAAKHWQIAFEEVELGYDTVSCKDKKMSIEDLAALADNDHHTLKASGYYDMPVADKGIEGLYGIPPTLFGSTAQIALVEVDTKTGYVEVIDTVCIPDAGKVINIHGLEGQAEGGTVMGMSFAIMEKVESKDGYMQTDNYDSYIIPTSLDYPNITVSPVEELENTGPFGAKGIAESLSTSITPAIIHAIYDAVGVRISCLPANMEKVLHGINQLKDEG